MENEKHQIDNTTRDNHIETDLQISNALSYKKTALSLIKKYYENFYYQYAATSPNKVNNIQEFLDWIKSSTEDNINVEKRDIYFRSCTLHAYVCYKYYDSSASFNRNFNIEVDLTDNKDLAGLYETGIHYSEYANSKIVPDFDKKIVETECNGALKKYNHSTYMTFHQLIGKKVYDPTKESIYYCNMNFPFIDYNGNAQSATLDFMVYNDKIYMKNDDNPGNMLAKKLPPPEPKPTVTTQKKQGCYIATCVYGSYDCPEVWVLRRYRDYSLDTTWYGRLFIKIYYALSPTIVKLFGKKLWFQKCWKRLLDKKVDKLKSRGIKDIPYNDKY